MIHLQQAFRRMMILGLFILVAGLAGCASMNTAPVYPTNTPMPTPDYSNYWLRKQPCAAPCWEGITPGVTTYKEALKLLEQNSSATNVKLTLPEEIHWDWRETNSGGWLRFDAWAEKPVIQSIGVGLPEPVKLKDVTSAFGYPSHVSADAEEGTDIGTGMYYGIHLYYIPSGFYFDLYEDVDGKSVKPVISPETEIDFIIFFVPSTDGLHKATNEKPVSWQGTFDFDTYCKLQYGSEADFYCQ